MTDQDAGRLDEFTADEWFEVMKKAKPDLTREDFDAHWLEFQAEKAKRGLQ